jgi:hypothetical protein
MHIYKVESGDYTSIAAARTILQWVTGSTRRSKILEIGISFGSVTATDAPVLVELGTETSAGTSSSATISAIDALDPAAISTALNNFSSTEPTGFSAVSAGPWRITPIGGTFVYQFPAGMEFVMAVSTRLALRVTPPASLSTAIRGYFIVQE